MPYSRLWLRFWYRGTFPPQRKMKIPIYITRAFNIRERERARGKEHPAHNSIAPRSNRSELSQKLETRAFRPIWQTLISKLSIFMVLVTDAVGRITQTRSPERPNALEDWKPFRIAVTRFEWLDRSRDERSGSGKILSSRSILPLSNRIQFAPQPIRPVPIRWNL